MPFSAVPTQGVEPRDHVGTKVSAKDERAPSTCVSGARACVSGFGIQTPAQPTSSRRTLGPCLISQS